MQNVVSGGRTFGDFERLVCVQPFCVCSCICFASNRMPVGFRCSRVGFKLEIIFSRRLGVVGQVFVCCHSMIWFEVCVLCCVLFVVFH